MYFASSVGRGFIISDEEEVTGVISVRNKVEIIFRFSFLKLYLRPDRGPLHSVKKYRRQSMTP